MAASANPFGDNNQQEGVSNGNGNGISVPYNSVVRPTQAARLSLDWAPDELTLFQDLLAKYASESNIVRCAEIAKQLKDKTVRDVALFCRWINENGKRRKEDNNSARKNKAKKEKLAVISMDSDDGIPCEAIGGATGLLLEQNAQALDQISANFGAFKIHDNINLFCQARSNILSILNDTLNELPEIMKKMPPFPVKLNKELAGSILPRQKK